MKCLIILVLVGGCLCDQYRTEGYYGDDDGTRHDDQDREKSLENDINRELREEKVRPCVLEDLDCIRKFLAANSNCKPTYGPAADPLIIPTDRFFFPSANVTITYSDLYVGGFGNAKITEFYVNKYTGNLVIAINVQKLSSKSARSYFTYQRTAKEPIVLNDYTAATYDSATFTAILPKIPHLKLDLAEIHADIHDGSPIYAIGPEAFASTDPDVVTAIAELIRNLQTSIREAYTFHASLITGVYIQKKLCDFGIDVYKNYLRFIRTKAFTLVSNDNPVQVLKGH